MPGWSAITKQARVASRSSSPIRSMRMSPSPSSAQEPGEDHMRRRRQSLPVGAVMALCLGAQLGPRPVGQRLAQARLGLGLSRLAVEVLEPGLQRARRHSVQRPQKLRLPVVPHAGADAADVARRQHRQQVEPPHALHRLGEVPHRPRVAEVALLRGVRHQQVVAHQPLDRLGFVGLQAQPGADAAGDPGAEDGVILGPALADVVQQQRDVEHAAVDVARLQDAARDRQLFDQLSALDLREVAHALDGVLVDREVVVHVELHHRHDRREFGNERAKHAEFVHPSQRALGVAPLEQHVEEDAVGLGPRAQALVDPVKVRRDEPHRVGVEQEAGPQRLVEDPQHVDAVGEEALGVLHGQPAAQDARTAP